MAILELRPVVTDGGETREAGFKLKLPEGSERAVVV